MTKKKASPNQENSLSKRQPYDNSYEGQQARLLDALIKAGSRGLSTIELREDLDLMSPAARIKELRCMGYEIDTQWTVEINAQGRKHRCGRYVLIELAKGVAS